MIYKRSKIRAWIGILAHFLSFLCLASHKARFIKFKASI